MRKNLEKLDAWQGCHALVIAVADVRKAYKGPEKKLVGRLFYLALRAAGRVAFGKGTGNRKMFLRAVNQAAGYVSYFQQVLSLARVMGVLTPATCDELDALRGRAAFYLGRLFESLLGPPPPRGSTRGS